MLCVDITPHYHNMCDSPILKFSVRLNDSLLRCVHSVEGDCDDDIHLDYVGFQVRDSNENGTSCGPCSKSNITFPYKVQLEQEVQTLQQKLREEMELHTILENAVGHTAGQLASLSYLPHYAQELLSSIAILEVTVSKLEKEMVSLHFQLSQERNERRLAEYHLKHSPSKLAFLSSPDNSGKPDSSSFGCSIHSLSEPCDSLEEISCQERRDLPLEASTRSSSTCSKIENMVDCSMFSPEKQIGTDIFQHLAVRKLTKEMPMKGLWNHPNKLSEEMVHCMKNIFISLSDSSSASSKLFAWENGCSPSSPHGHLSSSSLWSLSDHSMLSSSGQSPQVDLQCNGEVLATENACDPYRVHGKLSWADIGCYGLAVEVSWMSVGKEELEYAASALRRFRLLVEQLAKVNPIHLNCNEKLAFWINLYNALIMHAYLAYGIPRSDLKLFSLMQKAAYTVGGHSFSAAAIEYVILKMKPPVHRPQTALLLAIHKLKVSEEQRKVAIDSFEPLVMFALSCGMYSSPAVRIYTAKNVREELQEAQRDYIRASVGVSSKGRILVPKMLHCFAKGYVDDANLAVWISRYLPPHQAAFVEQCISQRRQRFLGSRNCGILPFDCRFRYLFLPNEITQ